MAVELTEYLKELKAQYKNKDVSIKELINDKKFMADFHKYVINLAVKDFEDDLKIKEMILKSLNKLDVLNKYVTKAAIELFCSEGERLVNTLICIYLTKNIMKGVSDICNHTMCN